MPALIDVDLKPGISPQAVAARVEAAVPGARFVAHGATLKPILRAIHSLTWVAFAIVLMIALATAAAVVLAARSALAANRPTIELMHGVGATDNQVARLFQRRIAIDSLSGGVAGALAAGVVLLVIAGGRAAWVEDVTGGPLLTFTDLAALALLPLLGTLLAVVHAEEGHRVRPHRFHHGRRRVRPPERLRRGQVIDRHVDILVRSAGLLPLLGTALATLVARIAVLRALREAL